MFREVKTGEKVVTAQLLLTEGRPPTGQKPPWQAVYTQQGGGRGCSLNLVSHWESGAAVNRTATSGSRAWSGIVGPGAGQQPPARRAGRRVDRAHHTVHD